MAAHSTTGAYGELLVARKLSAIAPVQPGRRADLRWLGLEIEVKTAHMSFADKDRRAGVYTFCLNKPGHTDHTRADVVILVLADTRSAYIIPAAHLRDRRVLRLSPRRSKYDVYREAWETLGPLIPDEALDGIDEEENYGIR